MTWEEIWQKILDFLTTTGIKLVVTVLIVCVGFFLISRLNRAFKKSKLFAKTDKNARSFIAGFVSILLKVLVVLTAVSYLGVPMTNVVAVLGSCGLAIGLALQGSLANVAGGLLILVFKPFKSGDFIEADGVSGTVREVTVLYTHLTTPDNRHIVIPNGELSNTKVINYSVEATRRMDIAVSASYKSQPDYVRGVLSRLAQADGRVLKDPAPTVNVASYDDSAITYTLRLWTAAEDYWNVNFDIKNAVKAELDKASIEIPYPQIDVHIDK